MGFRSKEMAWLSKNGNTLFGLYPGEWIAVDGYCLVAHADTLTKLLRQATRLGHPHPLITAVPQERTLKFYVAAFDALGCPKKEASPPPNLFVGTTPEDVAAAWRARNEPGGRFVKAAAWRARNEPSSRLASLKRELIYAYWKLQYWKQDVIRWRRGE